MYANNCNVHSGFYVNIEKELKKLSQKYMYRYNQ